MECRRKSGGWSVLQSVAAVEETSGTLEGGPRPHVSLHWRTAHCTLRCDALQYTMTDRDGFPAIHSPTCHHTTTSHPPTYNTTHTHSPHCLTSTQVGLSFSYLPRYPYSPSASYLPPAAANIATRQGLSTDHPSIGFANPSQRLQ